MSLDEGLNANLEKMAADGYQNHSAVPRKKSVGAIYKQKLRLDGHRQTFSLLSESNC